MRRAVVAAATVAMTALLVDARALASEEVDKTACFGAHEQGQISRAAGKLHAARDALLECANHVCGTGPLLADARKDCLELLSDVARRMPTVIVEAHRPDGKSTADARLFVDDQLTAPRLDGTPVEVDPGEHVFRYEMADAAAVEERVIVGEGQKDRLFQVAFHALVRTPLTVSPNPAKAPALLRSPTPGTRVAAYVLTGAALASVGVFAYFAVAGKDLENERAAQCGHACSPDQVAPVNLDYNAADVALGVGVIAAGASILLFLLHPHPSKATHAAQLGGFSF